MKFSEYKENRDTLEFDRKFSLLCEGIARSDHSFDSWWSSEGLPVIMESSKFEDEEELLVELMGGVGQAVGNLAGRAWRGMKNLGTGAAQGWQQGQQATDQWNPQQAGAEQPMDPENFEQQPQQDPNAQVAPQQSPEQQQRLAAFQRNIDQTTDQIKQRFSGAMRDFLGTVQNDAMQQNNSHMWEIAKRFMNSVNKAAQPAIDGFKQKAQQGGNAGYRDAFSQAHGQYSQNQQAALKQQLQQKQGAQGQVAGGPQDLAQQPQQDLTTPITQLAKQKFPAGAHMRPGMVVR